MPSLVPSPALSAAALMSRPGLRRHHEPDHSTDITVSPDAPRLCVGGSSRYQRRGWLRIYKLDVSTGSSRSSPARASAASPATAARPPMPTQHHLRTYRHPRWRTHRSDSNRIPESATSCRIRSFLPTIRSKRPFTCRGSVNWRGSHGIRTIRLNTVDLGSVSTVGAA